MATATPFKEVALMAADLLAEVEGRLTDPDGRFAFSFALKQVRHVADSWAAIPDDHDPDVVYAGATFAVGLLGAVHSDAGDRPSAGHIYRRAIEDAEYHAMMLK